MRIGILSFSFALSLTAGCHGSTGGGVSTDTARGAVLSVGSSNGCVVMQSGGVSCWGLNQYGQLGLDQNAVDTNSHAPTMVSGLGDVVGVGTKGPFSCALLKAGNVKCWGINGSGQLGNETTAPSYLPSLVHGPTAGQTLGGIHSISVGLKHACAVGAGGALYCWGANNAGQLGVGHGGDASIATQVPNGKYVDVSVGRNHTCALAVDGSVWCAGVNDMNELGIGHGDPSASFVQVPGITNAKSISAGDTHTCALLADASVKCWGGGLYGESNAQTIPNIKAVAAGNSLTCELTLDGHVYCLGNNRSQQIGPSSLGAAVTTAALIPGITGATALSVGESTACVVTGTGQVQCWGEDLVGEAGDGLRSRVIPSTTPLTLNLPGTPGVAP